MRQRIERVAGPGGAALAVGTLGEGRPLVYVSGWLSHLELSLDQPDERAYLAALGAGTRLVRYDRLGVGLSADSPAVPTLAGELAQLDAVVASVAEGPVDLMGVSLGAPVAAAWAAAHPDAVRRLVLYGGWADGAAVAAPEVRDGVLGLIDAHWGLGADVLTEIFAPEASASARSGFADYQRASSDAATARSLLSLSYDLDVRDRLAAVAAPTLVVHRSGDRAAPVEQARVLAEGIPDARLVVLSGRSHLPQYGGTAELVASVRRFLGLRAARRPGVLTPRQTEVAALIAAGLTNREIAARLGIEERSAEGHAERIRVRLGLRSRAQIAAWYAARPDN